MRLSNKVKMAGDIRFNQMMHFSKRLIGARFLNREDFLPVISAEQGQHLAGLARRAGGNKKNTILILGVMPRSGTNFIRDIVAMHPDVAADPSRLYEFPLLHSAKDAAAYTRDFLSYFPKNKEVLGEYDLLAMLAGAWLQELHAQTDKKHILLKCPHVQELSLARCVFPDAKIILCLRDGRDVLDSTLNTFSKYSIARKNFKQLAQEWSFGTEAIMTFDKGGKNENENTMVVRYEEIVSDQRRHVKKILDHIGLEEECFPWAEIDLLPVRGSSRSRATDEKRWEAEAKSSDFNPIKRWRSWSVAKKARFDRLAGSALELAGYER